MQKCILSSGKLDEELLDLCISSLSFKQTADGTKIATSGLTLEEVKNAVSTNAVAASQAATTGTTIGLGTAFKGLWIKIKSVTASMWKFLTTNPLGWATLAIGAFAGAALGIKKFNDSLEEAKKKIRETAEESKSAVKTIKSDFDELTSTTDNIKHRYAQLAQGVENLGKVNQSHGSLSNEEYAEFLDLSNQLAELFPQLTVNYDENGNAILGLSGNVNTIVGSLNDLVSAQQKLANQEIMKKMPDIWAGFMLDDEEFNRDLKSAEKAVESHLKWAEEIKKRSTLILTNESDNNLLVNAAKEAGIMSSRYGNDFYSEKQTASEYAANSFDSAEWDFTKLSDGEFNKLLNKLEEFGFEYEKAAQIVKGNISSANSGMAGYISTWLSMEWNFNKMDSDMQNVIKSMLQSGDWVDLMPENVDVRKWDDVSNWLQDEFLYEINKVRDNKKISKALSEIFSNQDLTPKEKADYIKQVQNYFGEGHAITLSLTPELALTEDLEKQYQDAIDFTKDTFEGYDPTELFKKHSINTEEEINAWRKIVEGAEDAAEAEKKYLNQGRNETVTSPLSISQTINRLNTRLKPAFDSLRSAYQSIFSLEENTDGQLFSLEDVDIETFESIRAELEKLDGIDGIKADYSAFENFVSILSDTSSTADEVHRQFDRLATSIIYMTDCTDMSAETYDLLLQSLTEMGAANAEEVLNNLKEIQEELTQAGYRLSDITLEEAVRLIELGQVSLETAEYLKLYLLQKELAQNPLHTVSDILALEQLCNSLGMTADMLGYVDALKRAFNAQELGASGLEPTIANLKAKIAGLANGQGEFKFNFSVPNAAKSASSSASSKDTHKEACDAELKELEHMHEMGLVSDAEYWKERMELNEKYFGESSGMQEKYLEEYRKNEEDILKGVKDLWKDYYEERKNDLKDLISYAEKLYDKEIDSGESSIKALEEKRDAEKGYWQERIDAVGNEIDALEDANDARERTVDLQQKQWNLQKAMNQRTILLYSEAEGMHYVNDSKAEREARNDLAGAEHDNKVAALKKQQSDLEKQLDSILETYDSQITSIEKQIDSLKQVKSAWSEIAENQELKDLEERVRTVFGDGLRDKILNGSTDFINSILSQYSGTADILRTIEDAALTDIQNMIAQYGLLPQNLTAINDAAAGIAGALGTVDTSVFNTNLDHTAQSSSNAAEKIQNTAAALNSLSNEVSNYQMPALNTDHFTSAFTEDGEVLSTLNGFIIRFKDICGEIPDIWNNSFAEAFGQGGGNGDPLAGGLPDDTKYETFFSPVFTALDHCSMILKSKLEECLGTFASFRSDLAGVIGVGSSEGPASGGSRPDASGADTIVGAIQKGGELIEESLNGENGWTASFGAARETIHGYADSIVTCIESMTEQIVNACAAAVDAINTAAGADKASDSNPAPPPYISIGHGHGETGNAHVEGTAKVAGDWSVQSDESHALVGEVGRELIVRDGKYFTVGDNGAEMFQIKKGDIVFNHEQTESLLKNGRISGHGKAYADGTVGGGKFLAPDGQIARPLQPGDRAWELQKAFEPLVNKILNGEIDIVSSAMSEHQRQMEQWTKNITYSNIMNSVANHNTKNVQPVVNHINITCPGVTEQQVAERIGRVLGKELDKQFSGFHNYTNQMSSIR